jgi:hypothetical protein
MGFDRVVRARKERISKKKKERKGQRKIFKKINIKRKV